jgi:competence protein ComEC
LIIRVFEHVARLAQLSPEAIVIGVGAEHSYGHPNVEALRLYAESGATVYRTDLNGTIIVEAQPSGAYTVRVERGEGAHPPPAPAPSPPPHVH